MIASRKQIIKMILSTGNTADASNYIRSILQIYQKQHSNSTFNRFFLKLKRFSKNILAVSFLKQKNKNIMTYTKFFGNFITSTVLFDMPTVPDIELKQELPGDMVKPVPLLLNWISSKKISSV